MGPPPTTALTVAGIGTFVVVGLVLLAASSVIGAVITALIVGIPVAVIWLAKRSSRS